MEKTLGKRISENRKRLKMTQDQLAEKLGVTAQAVSKWENDQSCPDIAMLPRLAEIFGISTDALLGRKASYVVHEAEIIDEEDENEGIHVHKGNWEFRWDSGRRSAIGFAILVLAVGVLYLLSQLLKWNVNLWDILWPTSFLIFGIWGLLEKLSFFRLGCVLFGGYSLAHEIFRFDFDIDGKLIWAVLIVLFGFSLLADALNKPKKPRFSINIPNSKKSGGYQCRNNEFSYSSSFGEYRQLVAMETLRYGEVSVSFGDYTIDLTEVENIAADCTVQATSSFGELRFIVPSRYRVITENATAFAATDVSGRPDDAPVGQIKLTGSVSFGEISIEYV